MELECSNQTAIREVTALSNGSTKHVPIALNNSEEKICRRPSL